MNLSDNPTTVGDLVEQDEEWDKELDSRLDRAFVASHEFAQSQGRGVVDVRAEPGATVEGVVRFLADDGANRTVALIDSDNGPYRRAVVDDVGAAFMQVGDEVSFIDMRSSGASQGYFGLSPETIRRLDEPFLSKELASDHTAVERNLYGMDEISVGTLTDRVSEIAMGLTAETYDREERGAAFAIRNALETIDRDEMMMVPVDERALLAVANELVTEINERVEDLEQEFER